MLNLIGGWHPKQVDAPNLQVKGAGDKASWPALAAKAKTETKPSVVLERERCGDTLCGYGALHLTADSLSLSGLKKGDAVEVVETVDDKLRDVGRYRVRYVDRKGL